MYIYNGKLNWYENVKNECFTIVFPAGLALNDPICAYWQWIKDGSDQKINNGQKTIIHSVSKTADEYRFVFVFDYYSFDSIVGHDFSSLKVTMRNPKGEQDKSGATELKLQYSNSVRVPSAVVYTGKLNWFEHAVGEMVTLVIPDGVTEGAPVCMYYQWTVDKEGNEKGNNPINTTFKSVSISSNGDVTGTFSDGFYTFKATMKNQWVELRMTNPSGETDPNAPYHLEQTDFRTSGKKRALIIRYGTGTDRGIFLVQEMLTKHLGFAPYDIEMSYFDVEPDEGEEGTMQCTSGQDPPTAKNFKAKFANLLSTASPGDVRFLYVDTHGTTYSDEDRSGEADGNDEGWILAETDDGRRKEVVTDDWVGQTIRKYLKAGANLTIVASSCFGGGMLDTHTATPGILLSGSHETQSNVKSLAGKDPWIFAIMAVIKKRAKRGPSVPTYTVLYNEAKAFVRAQFREGRLSESYKGHSPDETNPIPRNQEANTSNQDPQMIFYSGYIDPDQERFLFPFAAPNGGEASGEATRYPKDEYPREEL